MSTSFIPPRVKDLPVYLIFGHTNPYYEILDFEKIREFFSCDYFPALNSHLNFVFGSYLKITSATSLMDQETEGHWSGKVIQC